jgi:phage baseplate assembly protein gpV
VSRIDGVVVALVKDTDDKEGEGRVKVEFPWMEGKNEGYWAPVATMMSGERRGSWFMPETGDEVLVAFERGDVNHPFVVGFLWNGKDKPPIADGIPASVRRLRTKSGHILEFDDRDGKERILVKTQGDHEIELEDSKGFVRVETKGGHQLDMTDGPTGHVDIKTNGRHNATLTDGPTGSVEIKTSGNQKALLRNVPPGIEVSTSGGRRLQLEDTGQTAILSSGTGSSLVMSELGGGVIMLSATAGTVVVNCSQAAVSAKSGVVVSAPLTLFSGTVVAKTIVSQAVVSPIYTKGVLNFV